MSTNGKAGPMIKDHNNQEKEKTVEHKNNNKEYLNGAANVVEGQAMDHPGIGIPADRDVAEHMGIFGEEALSEQDVLDAFEKSAS
jgi:hypothetical protein